MTERTVTIGADEHPIHSFSGYKAVRAGSIVARITKKVPQILDEMAEFQRTYEENNQLRLTKEMAKLPKFSVTKPNGDLVPLFGEEDFAAAAKDGKDYISIPQAPTTMEKWAAVFPTVFEAAELELRELFGLILITNEDLEKADEADEVEKALAAKGRQVLHQAELSQMLELLVVSAEVLRGEFEGKEERLRPILGMMGMGAPPSPSPPEPSSSGPEPSELETEPETPETPDTSAESSEPSPTDSAGPTDGPAPTPSTESVGSSSSSSESG